MDYKKSIMRPFSDWKKLGIGGLMYLIPVVNIVTGMVGAGYTLGCAKTAMKKSFKLPEWKDFGKLFLNGLLMMVIGMLYFLPLLVIGMISLGGSVLTLAKGMLTGSLTSGVISGLGAMGAGMLITGIVLLLTVFVVPMAVVSFADRLKFADAFNFKSIFKKVLTSKYVAAWFVSLGITLGVAIVGSILSLILKFTVILPYAVSALVAITNGIIQMTIFGQAYAAKAKR